MAEIDFQDLGMRYRRALELTDRNHAVLERGGDSGSGAADLFEVTRTYARAIDDVLAGGFLPYGVPVESAPGPRVVMDFFGQRRSMILFASNDYLNLSTDPRVHAAITRALGEFGVGAGSSRINVGYSRLHRELEEQLAASFGKDAAILFPTGFDAIASTAQALLSDRDRALVDGAAHASIMDGARLSGATVRVFAHNSIERLTDTLRLARDTAPRSGILVMVEGAYSMDGDIAPLPGIVAACQRVGARLLVDEAHAVGVHGPKGHGVCEHFGLAHEVDLIAGTFSKSLGAIGGFVAGGRDVITYLHYLARRIVFSAALPPMLIAGVAAALRIIETDPEPRERLWNNVRYLAAGLRAVGARVAGAETASIPVVIGNDAIMFDLTRELIEAGIFTFPALYPTVPRNRSLFRLAVQSRHSKADLDQAIEVFGRLFERHPQLREQKQWES